jgi:hypothetical protein
MTRTYMTIDTMAVLSTVRLGLTGWTAAVQPIEEKVQVRKPRMLIVLRPDVDLMEVPMLVAEALSDEHSHHPGWEAHCPNCLRTWYRGTEPPAVHYCQRCGPEAGRLEFL